MGDAPASASFAARRAALRASLRFVAIAAALAIGFLLLAHTQPFERGVTSRSLAWNARIAASVLGVMGENVEAAGNRLGSTRFSMSVWDGCDAVEPMLLFAAAVLAAPVAGMLRLAGLLWGVGMLALINQIRLVTLFWTGVHTPRAFETVHLDVWQALFIALGIGTWLLWARWVARYSGRSGAMA